PSVVLKYCWVPGQALVLLASTVTDGGKRSPLPVSTLRPDQSWVAVPNCWNRTQDFVPLSSCTDLMPVRLPTARSLDDVPSSWKTGEPLSPCCEAMFAMETRLEKHSELPRMSSPQREGHM